MQGQTQSSESIWTAFNNLTTAYARTLKWLLKISWKRVVSSSGFAIVGSSLVNSLDTVQGLNSVVTEGDKFVFWDETDRLIRFEYDRTLQEPLGGMAMCIADSVLENTDSRFTPNHNATIGTAIIPNRPLQMFFGFLVDGISKKVPLFKGLTRQPKENKQNSTITIGCYDYIQYLNEYPLETAIYTDQRSDEIIEDILQTIGFGTSQYSLDTGLNTIGFAWFEKGQTAGERIRKICEAEEAFFHQDEAGILRFENRRHFSISPYNVAVWDIDPDDIISWDTDESSGIINRVIVTAKPREVQSTQEIWRDGVEEELAAGQSKEIWADFEDPVTGMSTVTADTDYLAYSATNYGGSVVTSDLTVSSTLFTKSVKLTLTNTSDTALFVPFLRVRGTPALVTSEIVELFQDNTSISKYGEHQFEFENDFIDDQSFCYYIARAIVRKYRTPYKRLILTVQGIPQLQLRDRIRVKDLDLGTYKEYRLMRIQGNLSEGVFTQKLYLREIIVGEADSWAIVGTTTVESQTEYVGL